MKRLYLVQEYSADTCGNRELTGHKWYVKANSEPQLRELLDKKAFFGGFYISEILPADFNTFKQIIEKKFPVREIPKEEFHGMCQWQPEDEEQEDSIF